jgi:hypothetical protein
MTNFPKVIHITLPDGSPSKKNFILRDTLHNGRPAWDLSLHHSLCWTPLIEDSEYGFWSVANLSTLDSDGQATGIVFETPECPVGDAPSGAISIATASEFPPLGWWTRGRPWIGDRTPGGRTQHLAVGNGTPFEGVGGM